MSGGASGTPARLGYRMPAEWEPHEATWLAWPHNRDDWPGKFASISWVYCELVRLLARHESVRVLVRDEGEERTARRRLREAAVRLENVEFFHCPTNRSWLRDTAPLFVKNAAGDVAATNWRFNAWAKYDDWQLDDAVADYIAAQLGLSEWRPERLGRRLVLEGGSIDVNGRGTLLTTEECLLSPVQARNPGLSREGIEEALREYLGAAKVLWLKSGIAGDDTHGHVDDVARFVSPDTVALVSESNSRDENYRALAENAELLQGMTSQDSRKLNIVKLPMPQPVVFKGQRLPASYANFYIANRQVLVPTFNDPNDRVALGILAELFPDREVMAVFSRDLVWGLGTIHCATQQQPATGVWE